MCLFIFVWAYIFLGVLWLTGLCREFCNEQNYNIVMSIQKA